MVELESKCQVRSLLRVAVSVFVSRFCKAGLIENNDELQVHRLLLHVFHMVGICPKFGIRLTSAQVLAREAAAPPRPSMKSEQF